ncbi:LOW QUALITY PROTEIN: hypothetical protein HID58_053651, partial [Brassica napus]
SGSPASGTNRASSLWFFAVIYLSEPSYLQAQKKNRGQIMVILSPSLGYSGTFGKGEMLWCLRKAESPLLHASLSRWKREIFGIWLTTMRIIRLRLWKQAVFTQLLGKVSPCFIKCNVGMAWDSSGPLRGASWVTRDSQCRPLDHSRRVKLKGYVVGCGRDGQPDYLKQRKILFEVSSAEVRQSLLDPYSYPELLSLSTKILELLHRHTVLMNGLIPPTAIADSVVSYFCTQSYVTRWWTLLASSSYPTGG